MRRFTQIFIKLGKKYEGLDASNSSQRQEQIRRQLGMKRSEFILNHKLIYHPMHYQQADEFANVVMKYEDFVQRKSKENPTFTFWSSYTDMVQILFLFVRATGDYDLQFHRSAIHLREEPGHDEYWSKGGDCLIDHVPEYGAVIFDGMDIIEALRDVPSLL
ncbi:unnamed protein product [Caretta caretta]